MNNKTRKFLIGLILIVLIISMEIVILLVVNDRYGTETADAATLTPARTETTAAIR